MYLKIISIFALLIVLTVSDESPEAKEGVKYANRCEVCKFLAIELQARLTETGKSHDVIETGYSVDDVKPRKRTEYRRSELRLLESLENVCERILNYNLHKERKDSTRFAKGMSQTFQALHGLVNKGVKVDLGIPYDLWDNPSVEVVQMKNQCETMLERHESDIENWYFKFQEEKSLIDYLCEERALTNNDKKCLKEIEGAPSSKGNQKGDKGGVINTADDDDDNERYGNDEL